MTSKLAPPHHLPPLTSVSFEEQFQVAINPTIMEPGRKKINTIECERVMAVFDNLLHRTSILAALPSIIINFTEFHQLIGAKLLVRIEHYAHLKERYDRLVARLEAIHQEELILDAQISSAEITLSAAKPVASWASDKPAEVPQEVADLPAFACLNEGNRDRDNSWPDQNQNNQNTKIPLEIKSKSEPSLQNDPTTNATPIKSDSIIIKREKTKSLMSGRLENMDPLARLEIRENLRLQTIGVEKHRLKLLPHIQQAVRHIIQAFKENPSASNAVVNHCKVWFIERSQSVCELLDQLKQLREIALDRLLTSPAKRKNMVEYLERLGRGQMEKMNRIKQLETFKADAEINSATNISQLNEVIKNLQISCHRVEKEANRSNNATTNKANNINENCLTENNETMTRLCQQLNETKQQLMKLRQANLVSEENLRSRKWKLQNELQELVCKYDTEIGDKNNEIEGVTFVYEGIKSDLEILEKTLEDTKNEYEDIQEEIRAKLARDDTRVMVGCAVTIQSFWRSYKVRRQLKRGGKSKK